mgnify:CR=1 FL=1
MEQSASEKVKKDMVNNYKVVLWEGSTYSLMAGMTAPFLGVMALQMGASAFQLSMVTALPNLINVMFMVPLASFLERRNQKLNYCVGGILGNRVGYFFLGLTAFLGLSPYWFLFILALMTIPGVLAGLSYTDIVAVSFPARERGKVFGAKNALVGLLTFVATMIAGRLLDNIVYPYNYLIVFSLASIFGLINMYTMSRFREPIQEQVIEKSDQEPYLTRLKKIFANPELGPQFKRFLTSVVLVHMGFNIPAALWTIFYVEEMHMTQSQIGNLSAINNAIIVFFSFYWGKKIQRSGDKSVFTISLIGISLVTAWAALSKSVLSLYLLQTLGGFSMAAYNITYFNILLGSSEKKYRPTAVATFHVLLGLTGVICPSIGVWLFKFLTARQVFWLSSFIRLAAAIVAFKSISLSEVLSVFHKPKIFNDTDLSN